MNSFAEGFRRGVILGNFVGGFLGAVVLCALGHYWLATAFSCLGLVAAIALRRKAWRIR